MKITFFASSRLLTLCGMASALATAGGTACAAENDSTSVCSDYPIRSAEMTNVVITGGFWLPRFETNRIVTVKTNLDKCEQTDRNENFRKAARREQGTFKGCPFDDSDVYKVIEGAAYTLASYPDAELSKKIDALIADIAGAQEPDGYLYTARTLGMEKVKGFPRISMMGTNRWANTFSSHEFYNMGHMIEAGVAYFEATGKRSLLNVAIRAADMMDRTFGDGPGQIRRLPGHEEIELALCRLYRVTGDRRYLLLAERLLSYRGTPRGSAPVLQNHLPVLEQTEAIGHAVRAGYLYTGMSDVAALLGDVRYRHAVDRLWTNLVGCKLHISGGIGAYRRCKVAGYRDSMGEAIAGAYDLPNENGYLETCAAIANAFFNDRMFRFTGDGKYMDIVERIIYNGFLSGISLSGDEFFYQNPLASFGGYRRSKWFGCSCCPPNVARFIPQIACYAYATGGETIYWNLFIDSKVKLATDAGEVTLEQHTDYPWSGRSELRVGSSANNGNFALKVRIPGWALGKPVPSSLYEPVSTATSEKPQIAVNGAAVPLKVENGYVTIRRAWKRGDRVTVDLPMEVRRIRADARVEADRGRLAVERGPVVWCAEGADNDGKVIAAVVDEDARFKMDEVTVCGQRFPSLKTTARDALVGVQKRVLGAPRPFTLIPYFAWCHRGAGEMQVWLPTTPDVVKRTAMGLKVEYSHLNKGETLESIFDGRVPESAAKANRVTRSTFWPHLGTTETVTLTLPGEETIRGVDVYWYDDALCRGRCRKPANWKVQVQLGPVTGWADVPMTISETPDGWSHATFQRPEPGVAVRLVVELQKNVSAGICELKLR